MLINDSIDFGVNLLEPLIKPRAIEHHSR
jgi:hypothetical protein